VSARALLENLREAGFTVEYLDTRLRVKPTPSPELVERVRHHKDALIELLTAPSPDQIELAHRSTKHPLPPGAPVCAACGLLLCGAGQRRGRDLYHPARGPCVKCGHPVLCTPGDHAGLRNAFGDLVHLRCPG
jgi:hypothetical protein